MLAVLVICGFAVSGHITKNMDSEMPTAQTTSEVTTQATTNAVSSVSLVAVGDNLIHNTLISAGEQEDGSLDYSSFYENIKNDISSADIAVINQETILGGSEFEYTGYPVFNSPWEIGTAAIDAALIFLPAPPIIRLIKDMQALSRNVRSLTSIRRLFM